MKSEGASEAVGWRNVAKKTTRITVYAFVRNSCINELTVRTCSQTESFLDIFVINDFTAVDSHIFAGIALVVALSKAERTELVTNRTSVIVWISVIIPFSIRAVHNTLGIYQVNCWNSVDVSTCQAVRSIYNASCAVYATWLASPSSINCVLPVRTHLNAQVGI